MTHTLTAVDFTVLEDKQLSYLERAVAIMDALPDTALSPSQVERSNHAANLARVSETISLYIHGVPRSID